MLWLRSSIRTVARTWALRADHQIFVGDVDLTRDWWLVGRGRRPSGRGSRIESLPLLATALTASRRRQVHRVAELLPAAPVVSTPVASSRIVTAEAALAD
jgi:hypothetical protein